MSWPTDRTPLFYVHDRRCTHCGKDFKGFSRSKYCSPECQEMFHRAKTMLGWGVPGGIVRKLCAKGTDHA